MMAFGGFIAEKDTQARAHFTISPYATLHNIAMQKLSRCQHCVPELPSLLNHSPNKLPY
jgi:hypothetical protein